MSEQRAVGAKPRAHPFAVAVFLETVLPYVPETVLVDVALLIGTADAQTAGNAAIAQHRSYRQSRNAGIDVTAYPFLVVSQETFAGIGQTDFILPSGLYDDVHQLPEFLVIQQ